jgi:hypothetical protein
MPGRGGVMVVVAPVPPMVPVAMARRARVGVMVVPVMMSCAQG